ncbi:MAG: serine/threonine protein kinase/tetratricopeptide (TPR) repeat protein [Candidatus Azotimanducaceae bacterium]|jgi:serine/threonine protein kinase/tetratricopeptide (TPR) repeat protein
MTTQEEWLNIKQLYAAALDVSEADRAGFIEDNTPPKSTLRAEVLDLLGYSNEAESFFGEAMEELVGKENLAVDDESDNRMSDPYNLIGETFSHYQITKQLGHGSMGILYQAIDNRLERTIALKFLTPNGGSAVTRKRMLREARMACSLDHHNVGVIHDIGQTNSGHDYIAMGYYDGVTLDTLIEQQTLTLDQIVRIGLQIADGLVAIHEKNVVHCDIKPSNIMICQNNRVVILDFGVAKLRNVDLTDSQSRLGTISYMSPEHLRGEAVDARSDVWSLGVVLYEMLAGARPFAGSHPEAIFYSLLHAELADMPSTVRGVAIPKDLDKLIKACLIRDRENRIASCEILQLALFGYKDATLDLSHMSLPAEALSSRRQKTWIGISVIIMLIFVGGALLSTKYYDVNISSSSNIQLPEEKFILVLNKPNGSKETNLLLEGLMASVTNKLKLIERVEEKFWVVSTDEAKDYGNIELEHINQSLGANLVLFLESKENGNNIELILNLVDTVSLKELGRQTLIFPKTDLRRLSNEILGAVFRLLNFENTATKRKKLTTKNTGSIGALTLYYEGLASIQRSDQLIEIDRAIVAFKTAIEIDSEYASAYAFLGKAYWHKYNETNDNLWLVEASRNLEISLTLDSNVIDTFQLQGLVNNARGHYGSAKAIYKLILADSNSSFEAIIGLAKSHENSKQFADAEGFYLRAIALRPDNWLAHNYLGTFYAKKGRFPEAMKSYNRGLVLTPRNAKVLNNLANVYSFLGDTEAAKNLYEKSVTIQPAFKTYFNLTRIYYHEKEYLTAYNKSEEALLLNDSHHAVWGLMASAAYFSNMSNDKFESALKNAVIFAEKQFQLNPLDKYITVNLASYYALLRNAEKARELISKFDVDQQFDPPISHAIGEVHELIGERYQALTWIKKSVLDGKQSLTIENNPWLKDLILDPSYIQFKNDGI